MDSVLSADTAAPRRAAEQLTRLECRVNPTTRSGPWTGTGSSRSRRPQRATGWSGLAWRYCAIVRRLPLNPGQPPGRVPDPPRLQRPPAWSAGGTGCCRGGGSAPWRSTSRSTSTAARPWRQMAAVVRLNPYHFARQFKAGTGLPPHQYVILRRVEWAKHLLQAGTDLSLAEVALVRASVTRASSPATSSDSSASRRGSSERPQESSNSPQFPPRSCRATPLPFLMSNAGWRRRPGGADRSGSLCPPDPPTWSPFQAPVRSEAGGSYASTSRPTPAPPPRVNARTSRGSGTPGGRAFVIPEFTRRSWRW